MTDLILAILHHVLVFGLISMMLATRVLLSTPVIPVARLARLDAGVGGLSFLVLIVGVVRAVWGGKGWAFYESNPFFWGKLGCFFLIGALSVPPTLAFLRWAKALKADAGFQPPAEEVRKARTFNGLQALAVIPLLICAAAMARWGSF